LLNWKTVRANATKHRPTTTQALGSNPPLLTRHKIEVDLIDIELILVTEILKYAVILH